MSTTDFWADGTRQRVRLAKPISKRTAEYEDVITDGAIVKSRRYRGEQADGDIDVPEVTRNSTVKLLVRYFRQAGIEGFLDHHLRTEAIENDNGHMVVKLFRGE